MGDQEYFIARATLAIMPGQKVAHKRLTSSAASPARPACPLPSWLPAWQLQLPLHQALMHRCRHHRRRLRLRLRRRRRCHRRRRRRRRRRQRRRLRRLRRVLSAWRRRVRGILALSAMELTVQDLQDW